MPAVRHHRIDRVILVRTPSKINCVIKTKLKWVQQRREGTKRGKTALLATTLFRCVQGDVACYLRSELLLFHILYARSYSPEIRVIIHTQPPTTILHEPGDKKQQLFASSWIKKNTNCFFKSALDTGLNEQSRKHAANQNRDNTKPPSTVTSTSHQKKKELHLLVDVSS